MERRSESPTSLGFSRKATPRTIRSGRGGRGQGPLSVDSLCVRFAGLQMSSPVTMREDSGQAPIPRPSSVSGSPAAWNRPFAGFFDEGSIGRCLFPLIRSLLQVDDLVTLSKTCFVMNHRLARTYTVAEILRERGHTNNNMTEQRRIVIATEVRSLLKYRGNGARPQRVTQGDRGPFWANLYHPDHELDRAHEIIDAFGLQSPAQATRSPRYGKIDGSFYGFFYSEVDAKLFTIIRQFLTVSDVNSLIQSNVLSPRDGVFHTISLEDVLVNQEQAPLSVVDRIRLGSDIRRLVTAYRGSVRPHRVVEGVCDRWGMQFLYHPEEYLELVQAVEVCLRYRRIDRKGASSKKPVLLHAFYVGLDVTYCIASAARRNDGFFRADPPPRMRGANRHSPRTFSCWYTRIFGDHAPHTTKFLQITVRDSDSTDPSHVTTHTYWENERVALGMSV